MRDTEPTELRSPEPDPRVRSERRVWMACTVCGPRAEPAPPRFADERELWQYLFGDDDWGWARLADGRILCPAHRNVVRCEHEGHVLCEWTTNPMDAGLEWQFCSRCGAGFEQRRTAPRGNART